MHICSEECPFRGLPQDLGGNHIVPVITATTADTKTPEEWRRLLNTPLDAALCNYK